MNTNLKEIRESQRLIGVVYQRKDGAWEAMAFGPSEDGHRYSSFDTQADAIAWIKAPNF